MQKNSGDDMKKGLIFFIVTFSIITFILTSAVLFKMGKYATFFTIDPDVPYLGNSLLYIISRTIGFNTHPGTPTILLHSLVLLPIRFYTHFIIGIPFITWVFQNMYSLFHYVRYFQSLLLSVSMAIFLLSIYNNTKSKLSTIFAFLALLTFSSFPYFGITITPETLSFFLVSLWLLIFSYYQKSHSPFIFILLPLVAGVALANKLTNLPVVLVSFLLAFTLPNMNTRQKILNLVLSVFLVGVMFLVSTWPIRQTYAGMFKWVNVLATTSGVQGSGEKTIFNLDTYTQSFKMLISREKVPFYIVISTFLFILSNRFIRKDKLISPINSMFLGVSMTFIIFSKYYLSYYQLANYLIAIYILADRSNTLPKVIKIIASIILISAVVNNILSFYSIVLNSSQKADVIEQYIKSNPSEHGTVWLWGRSKDFAILWARDWTGGWVFGDRLKSERDNLYELSTNFEKITTSENYAVDLFDRCWDHLYIIKSALAPFLQKYPQYTISYKDISGSDDIVLITSSHCRLRDK